VCGLASTSRNSHAKEGSEPLQGVRPGERVHVSGCAWGAMRDVNPCAHRRRKSTKTEIAREGKWLGRHLNRVLAGENTTWRGVYIG
jgi:hypothetical protein